MPHPFDLSDLVKDMTEAASGVLKKDVATFRGFSERQLQQMAKQAAWIAEATAKGELDEELRDEFLDSLSKQAKQFAMTLRGLMELTIEKVWAAVIDVLWSAIEAVVPAIRIPRLV